MVSNRAAARLRPGRSVDIPRSGRVFIGITLFAHAVLHAYAGMVLTAVGRPIWTTAFWTLLWASASGMLVAAAYGMWGWRPFALHWRALVLLGTSLSVPVLLASGHWWAWVGISYDLLIHIVLAYNIRLSPTVKESKERDGLGTTFAKGLGFVFLAYGIAVILARPLHQNWGATPEEIARVFPGEEALVNRSNLINHVVTINAPAERVWPYIVQIGQDRAGFYSYDWLERSVGDHVTNVYEVRPQWQGLKVGDYVRLTQPNYFAGLLPDGVKLRVRRLVPNKLMDLEGWGNFWVEDLPNGRSRFGVRSPVAEMPLWAAPIEVFAFEPTHFIMEQRMLRTVRDLAER